MVQAAIQECAQSTKEIQSFWSSLNLLTISSIMLIISVAWRVIDQFVLGLGDTWMNIMPSKLFPFLIILGFFLKYRRNEIDSVLGLSQNQLRVQLAVGLVIGLMMSLMIYVGGDLIYGLFIDPTYPLNLYVINTELLGYMFLFFLTNAFLEETLFRGLLQNAFKTRVTPNRAILFSAIVFGLWHAGWPFLNGGPVREVATNVFAIVFFSTILGFLFGVYYERFSSGQSLVGLIVIHTLLNFIGECFKIGPDPIMQGPDIMLSNQGLAIVSFVLFFMTFLSLFMIYSRFKIEQAAALWKRFTEGIRYNVNRTSGTNANN